jgi:hypothetical protein
MMPRFSRHIELAAHLGPANTDGASSPFNNCNRRNILVSKVDVQGLPKANLSKAAFRA